METAHEHCAPFTCALGASASSCCSLRLFAFGSTRSRRLALSDLDRNLLGSCSRRLFGVLGNLRGDAGIVESYISYLRRKIDGSTSEPMIVTKRGFGYMLKSPKA